MLALIDKPTNYTSFDIIRKLKKLFPKIKIGHSGTLDPMATGLLIIGIDKDTKRLESFLKQDKTYITQIDFSKDSDTWDLNYFNEIINYKLQITDGIPSGIIKNGEIINAPTLENIKQKLDSIIGECELPLPNFSAKKVGGKKLYDLARSGENLNLSRIMKVYSYEIIDYNFPFLKLKLDVGSGCYIRSIGYWLGKQFELGGLLSSLRRIKIGKYIIQ